MIIHNPLNNNAIPPSIQPIPILPLPTTLPTQPIPIHQGNAIKLAKFKTAMLEKAADLVAAIHSLQTDELENIHNSNVDTIQLITDATTAIASFKPKDPQTGLTLYTPKSVRAKKRKRRVHTRDQMWGSIDRLQQTPHKKRLKTSRKRPPNSAQNIPFKQATKPQQKLQRQRKDKKERLTLKRAINPFVVPETFEKNMNKRKISVKQRTDKVIANKEKRLQKIPSWIKETSIDLNDTISQNETNHNRRTSTRVVQPSQNMRESMDYQRRMNGFPMNTNTNSNSKDQY